MIIGLTGAYCAGKNYIAALFEKRGFAVLDVDKLGYKVIEDEKQRLIERFGADILNSDGTVNRKSLGAKVFGKPRELADLEDLIHPAVNKETAAWIETQKGCPCVINAALLHRSSSFAALNAIIIVQAPFLTRLLRAKKRDKLSFGVLLKRFSSQKDFPSQYFQKKADIYRVKNYGYFGLNLCIEEQINRILSVLGLS